MRHPLLLARLQPILLIPLDRIVARALPPARSVLAIASVFEKMLHAKREKRAARTYRYYYRWD